MTLESTFVPLELDQLHREAAVLKTDGWRFIQTHAVKTDDGVDLYYSFMKDGAVVNYRIEGVTPDQPVPSITDLFLAAFVFENEARELFGVDMRDIALDFSGAMYAPAVAEPMTIISPEQKAAREKAAKAAAAQKAKEEGKAPKAEPEAGKAPAKKAFVMTPERRARLDAKLATMSPDKAAKVEAALKAREAEAASPSSGSEDVPAPESDGAKADKAAAPDAPVKEQAPAAKETRDAALEATLAAMDPDKAAKVRAALEGKKEGDGAPAAQKPAPENAPEQPVAADAQVEHLVGLMDADKADIVRKALGMKKGE